RNQVNRWYSLVIWQKQCYCNSISVLPIEFQRDWYCYSPKAKVLYSFGREDQLDVEAIRLIKSMSRFLSPEEAVAVPAQMQGGRKGPLKIKCSRYFGGPWLLDQLWQRLGIRSVLQKLLEDRRYQAPVERALFSLVANCALAPSSKLKVEEWVQRDAFIEDLPEVPVQQLYRSMDFVLEAEESLQREVYCSVVNLLNMEVDLLYFDSPCIIALRIESGPTSFCAGWHRFWCGSSRTPPATVGRTSGLK
ncbi:MAG: hypothetical protein R6U70_10480, partial [Bacillota bacterium]